MRGATTEPTVCAEEDEATRTARRAATGARCFMARVYKRPDKVLRSEGPEVSSGKDLGFPDAKAYFRP
jgi:hypothetical protein